MLRSDIPQNATALPFVLSCCSTADRNAAWFEERRIAYVPFHVCLDGQNYPDDLGQSLPFPDFYRRLAEGAVATTSQVNVGEFLAFFEPMLQNGSDVLHISFSSGLSGAWQSACIAAGQLRNRYPNRRIEVLDSLCASSGYGLLVEQAADLRDRGASYDEVVARILQNRLRLQHWFFSTDLSAYIRGGRIGKVAGFVGGMMGVCPVLRMDASGHLVPFEKALSKKKAIKRLAELMMMHAEGGRDYAGKVLICHAACPGDAQALAEVVAEFFPRVSRPIVTESVGTVIGSHTGIGTVALFFMGDTRE